MLQTSWIGGLIYPFGMENHTVRDHAKDHETLSELNRNYVRSVGEADTTWFDANLASDFLNTNPDGTLIDRNAFIAQIGRGSSVKNIREHDVIIRIFGDFAIIHACTAYLKPDGTSGGGRYTDDWLFRDGRWQCISAHVARH
jgi:Domain of unknown function (DUF4440)